MFNTILIANRGEIACRIIKTAKALGIKTIAIYSSADAQSLHTQLADEAYYIGEAPSRESYLNIKAIIAVAIKSGANAIHPGYGFLSENPEFAQACHNHNIVFIGPDIPALKAMGSKQFSKQLLEGSEVPLTPGYHGNSQTDEVLFKEAQRIGFPVLLKAANGGGGKGMKSVFDPKDFALALASARREALASFGDELLIIEKLVQNPRHIEVQIMADNHGQIVHLFERDCSIQRRHQKIIEEAPAPNLSPLVREKLCKAAIEVAKKIAYRGAGTVEFLLSPDDTFYFMEMNTRLQVEHPVTEQITGLDLVEWQIRIAANEPLPLKQSEIHILAHAIECRLYAEDPDNQFLPSIGKIQTLYMPESAHVRVDTGVFENALITQYYDPMIAKIIGFGKTREMARVSLYNALRDYRIGGVKTNNAFLQAILNNQSFKDGQYSTDFLNKEPLVLPTISQETALLFAGCADYLALIDSLTCPLDKDTLGFQPHSRRSFKQDYNYLDTPSSIVIKPIDHKSCEITINNITQTVSTYYHDKNLIIDDGHRKQQGIIKRVNTTNGYDLELYTKTGHAQIKYILAEMLASNSAKNSDLSAPMPSTVVAILKQKGERVKLGECLLVLEAMKMEHAIHAPKDGLITEVFFAIGAQVNEGATLLAMD